MKGYIIKTKKIIGHVELSDENIIIESAPIFSKFKGQPIKNLTSWLRKISGGCSLERFKND